MSDLPRRGQALREVAEHDRVIGEEARLPKLVERSTEQLESLAHIAALDESDSVVAPSRAMPVEQPAVPSSGPRASSSTCSILRVSRRWSSLIRGR
jgi:hypothetical protein